MDKEKQAFLIEVWIYSIIIDDGSRKIDESSCCPG
jgi:hypothetical protein